MVQLELPQKKQNYTKEIRERLGLGITEFANLLGMNNSGERTVRGWENGEHEPSSRKLENIEELKDYLQERRSNAPFAKNLARETAVDFAIPLPPAPFA